MPPPLRDFHRSFHLGLTSRSSRISIHLKPSDLAGVTPANSSNPRSRGFLVTAEVRNERYWISTSFGDPELIHMAESRLC